MRKFYSLLLHFLCISWLKAETLLQIPQGKLNGTIQKSREGRDIISFLGIPYAQPPTGDLRFKNPRPPSKWEGIRQADSFGSECVHSSLFGHEGNEDCLFLNVYTPLRKGSANALLPVMVWIHGGAFIFGSGNNAGAEYLLDKDVVLVSLNYRLGILGFFSTGDSAAPGNFGLKDQVQALKWVQKNIKSFGGDPKKVTIFGQSAGAASVALLALSKASDGLFQQYIIQSGSSLCPWAYRNSSEFKEPAKELAEDVGCKSANSQDVVKCLQKIDVDTLIKEKPPSSLVPRISMIVWSPTDEPDAAGAFLTDSPKNLMRNNQMKDLPFMSGVVADEGLLFTKGSIVEDGLYGFIRLNLKSILSSLAEGFSGIIDRKKFVTALLNYYFNGSVFSLGKDEFIKAFTNVVSDGAFNYPELRMLQKVTLKMKNSNYLYSFGYTTNSPNYGVAHTAELPYLFPSSDTINVPLSKIMVDLWTSFAIHGKPQSDKLSLSTPWEPYNPKKNIHLQIGDVNNNTDPKISLSNSFYPERMNFWQEIVTL